MSSKRDIIKNYKLEVKKLEDKIKAQANAYSFLEKKLKETKRRHEWDLSSYAGQCKMFALRIDNILSEEFVWQELVNDPTTKMAELVRISKFLKSLMSSEEL